MAHVVETNVIHRSHDRAEQHAMVNQYQILCHLGEGMHGRVMLAVNTHTNERVAVKSMRRIDPHNRRLPKSNRPGSAVSAQQETESKIRREIAVMKKCSHQNLVQLREVIDDSQSKKIYLVMENLAGGEILWRNKDGPVVPVLTLDQVQRIMRDVTLGLEYLHHQGIIHRDIKPANLLWTEDRQSVKICDFGVSHFSLATAQDGAAYDEVGLSKTAGSPAFFAPEVCNWSIDDPDHASSPPSKQPAITKQIDIWALGVTFYCLLFGTPPWQGHNEFAMFRSICHDEFIVPDKMGAEGLPTGGRDFRPEGRELGWCVVRLLNGLLEKDQTKRITLLDIKRIPWIHTGVRDPERWIHETSPESQQRVTVTDQDTANAIGAAFFSNMSLKHIKNKIQNSLPRFSRARPRQNAVAGPSTAAADTASSSHTRAARRQFGFKFGTAGDERGQSPSRSNTIPKEHRRSAGKRSQTRSDPASRESRSASTSSPCPSPSAAAAMRRPSDSLLHPPSSSGRGHFLGSATSSPVSPTASPTTPSDDSHSSGLRMRFSALFRQQSRAKNKARAARSTDDDSSTGARMSAETLDVRSSSESAALSIEQRAASWACGAGYDDDQSSEVDPTRSVVAFGAGGYVDHPTPGGVYQQQWAAGSDSSTSTATPQPLHVLPPEHAPAHPPRVRSPLARDRSREEDAEDLASDVFDEPPPPDSSSEEEVLELRTRRPSTVLSRSANTSPLRR